MSASGRVGVNSPAGPVNKNEGRRAAEALHSVCQDREPGGPRFYVRRPACFPAGLTLNQMRFSSDTCVLDNLTKIESARETQTTGCLRRLPPQVDGLAAPLRGAALRANTTSSGTNDLGAAAMRATHADIHVLQGLAHPVGMRLR